MTKSGLEEMHVEKVGWAILMSQSNLDEYRDGDWLNLKEELYNFTYWPVKEVQVVKDSETPSRKKYLLTLKSVRVSRKGLTLQLPTWTRQDFIRLVTKHDLEKLQTSFRACFEALARGTNFTLVQSRRVSISIYPNSSNNKINRLYEFEAANNEGNYIHAAKSSLMEHLCESRITMNQIRFCSHCGKLFLAKRKPRADRNLHCSLRCTGNAATRAYRQRKEEELKLRERKRNRRRYVERQQKKYGPRVKVVRRPRKARGG